MSTTTTIRSLLIASLLVGATGTSLARQGSDNTASTGTTVETHNTLETSSVRAESETHSSTTEQETEAAKQRNQAKLADKLDEAKKRKCEQISSNISKQSANFIAHAQKQLATFEQISQKTQAFAVSKNLTVDQEQTLLASIQAAKAKVEQDLAMLKADSAAFKCDGQNPKGALKSFHNDAALVRSHLKGYRNLVRQLIQAVRSANGQTKTNPPKSTSPHTGGEQ